VKAEIDAKRQVIAEAKAAEKRRQAELRTQALERLKQVEEWAARLERANRLRSLADKFQTENLSLSDGVIDADWIRRAADWLDPTVVRRWDEVDGPRDDTVE
jgi:vacuolar-type H+-ATPase subunit I/STV1